MSIAEFSVNRPVTTIMIIVSVVTLGMISYTKLPLMFLPDMSFPSLNVSVPYPSSSPEEVERLITRPLEDAFGTLSNMKSMESRSRDDNAQVRIEFETGTDMNMAAMEVRDRVDQVRGDLPEDVERIRIRRWNPSDMPIYNFSVAWGGDPAEFYNIVTKVIQPRIQRVDGVANVEISGMIDKQLLVHVDAEKLQSHNLDLFNLSQTLVQNNVTLTAGTVTEGGRKYSVRSVNEYRAAEEVANLPIPGTTLSLRDVAEVTFDYPENDSFQRLNGVDAVTVRVYKTSTANIVDVAQRTRSVLDELQGQPRFADLETRVFFDQSQSITDRLSDLRNTGLLGGMLAVIVLFLFLRNVRSTLIISLAIPISIICTFTFMYLLRQGAGSTVSINLISLMGLMLAVGMLVDAAVVVLESIYRHRQEGNLPARIAAVVGTREVTMAIIAATATTLCVFMPLVFLGGGSRFMLFMKDFVVTFCIVMVAAVFIALTLIPLVSSRLFNRPLGKPSSFFAKLSELYSSVLAWNLRHRFVTVVAFGAILYGSYWLYQNIETEFQPQAPTRDIAIAADLPGSYSIEDVKAVFTDVEELLLDRKDDFHIESISSYGSLRRANIRIVLTPPEDREESATELQTRITSALPEIAGVRWRPGRMRRYGGGQSGVDVELRGDNMSVLSNIAEDIRIRMEGIQGMKDVDTSLERGDEEVRVQVDRAMAQTYGISPRQAARTVQAALSSRARGKFKADDREVDILLQLEEEDRASMQKLQNMVFERAEGGMIPVGNLASFTRQKGPDVIERFDRESQVEVGGNTTGPGTRRINTQVTEMMQGIELPPGYTWSMGRNWSMMRESQSEFLFAILLSVVLIYLIMAAISESFIQPFTILLSVLCGLVGAFIVFYLSGTTLNTNSYLGIIVLSGLAVNNAIVLIDHVNRLRRDGMTRTEALLLGGRHRLRPILMTSLTTIFGLLPMVAPILFPEIFGPVEDRGANQWGPVSLALVGGLTTSGILTLILLPTVYTIFEDLSNWVTSSVKRAWA